MRTATAAFLAISLAATASGSIVFDLAGIDHYGSGLSSIGVFDDAEFGAEVESISLNDGVLETYNNTGTPNFANEAILAVRLADADGDEALFYFFPYPDEDGAGQFGPVNLTIDLAGDGYYIPPSGDVTAYAASIWDDGSGVAAGTWLQGTLSINLVPAPAGLAIFAGSAFLGCRRRRRNN